MNVRVLSSGDVRAALDDARLHRGHGRRAAAVRRGRALPAAALGRAAAEVARASSGLMTAHRAGRCACVRAQGRGHLPREPARAASTPTRASSSSSAARTAASRRIVDASAVTAIRTAAVSAVATRALAREGASTLAVLGAGRAGRRAHRGHGLRACRSSACASTRAAPSRRSSSPPRRAERYGVDAERRGVGRGGAARRRRRRHRHDRARADRRARLARSRGARQRRRLEHPDDARARRRHDGRGAPRRRRARVDASTSRATSCSPVREGALAGDVSLVELGEVLSGSGARAHVRRRADRLHLARPRGRGPRRRRARPARRRGGRARQPRCRCDPARLDHARARDARGAARCARRWCACASTTRRPRSTSSSSACSRSARSRSAARSTRWPRRRPGRSAKGVVTASAGNMAQGVAWGARERGMPVHRRRARHRAADEARRDRAARRPRPAGAVRGLVARDRDLRAPGRRGVLRASRAGRRRDGRQRHDRARDPRGPARTSTPCSSPGAAAA